MMMPMLVEIRFFVSIWTALTITWISFIHSFIHLFIYLLCLFIYLFIYLFIMFFLANPLLQISKQMQQ